MYVYHYIYHFSSKATFTKFDVIAFYVVSDTENCTIKKSRARAEYGCACKDGYDRKSVYQPGFVSDYCVAIPCLVPNSNKKPGPDCACLSDYTGKILWTGREATGQCDVIPITSAPTTSTTLGKQVSSSSEKNIKITKPIEATKASGKNPDTNPGKVTRPKNNKGDKVLKPKVTTTTPKPAKPLPAVYSEDALEKESSQKLVDEGMYFASFHTYIL